MDRIHKVILPVIAVFIIIHFFRMPSLTADTKESPKIQIINPRNGSTVENERPTLSWTKIGDAVFYHLKIVELGTTQRPVEALHENPSILEIKTDKTSFPYPSESGPLTKGRTYAWQIVALSAEGDRVSKAAYFHIKFIGQTVTREDAISIIIYRHIVPPKLDKPVVAFLGRTLLHPGDAVWPDDEPTKRREIISPTWFSWIDDNPKAFFAHETRFVFIDAATGHTEVMPSEWWPVLNGESIWMSDMDWADKEIIIYSEIHLEEVK